MGVRQRGQGSFRGGLGCGGSQGETRRSGVGQPHPASPGLFPGCGLGQGTLCRLFAYFCCFE
ncbi:hypothetical protein ASZ90_001790 [hydrocarbon metagenome]|uniref:Uncharacterized protein n=1 Tax=hydrocarbon metagenome TaxID=938273 RepID=A0A0W8G5C5_9ZZZZ